MASFSLIEALKNLYIDPFPTQEYRSIVNLLQNITIIMEALHEVRICCIDDIVAKLTINLDETPENLKNRFVPTVEVYKMLTHQEVPIKFNYLLTKLLLYIIIKLSRCTSEDAPSILHDYRGLQNCIFVFRKYSPWDNTRIDEIVIMFQKKLIEMTKELTVDNVDQKFHLFSIMRIMITELGKHPVYSAQTVKQLNEEIKNYYEHVKALAPNTTVNEFVSENHLTLLYILNDIIAKNFVNNNKAEGKIILADLRDILNDIVTLNKMDPRETYLVQNILKIIEIYQLK